MTQQRLFAAPCSLAEANKYVRVLHRHNGSLPSSKMAVACVTADGSVVGVAVAGIPKARMLNDGGTLEVNRVCTDGTPNACSFLYGVCARVAKALGYWRLVTYTLMTEPGVSLKAAGWAQVAEVNGRSWTRRNASKGNPDYQDRHNTSDKWRWELVLRDRIVPTWPDLGPDDQAAFDFGGVA